jgi:UDP-glucose 4-epimerase
VNLFKTLALFHACADNTRRVVFSSSSSVYGNTGSFPTPETTEKNPRSPYALQKLCSEKFAAIFCELYDVDIVSLRYFNVYGPRQYGDSPYATAISAWCHCVKEGTPLRSDGDGTQVRDLTYVSDVVKANILAATCESDIAGECYNIGSGNCNSNNHILGIFKDRFDDVTVKNAPWRPGDVMKTHANIDKAMKHLGYKPSTQLQEGIQKTFEWWGI